MENLILNNSENIKISKNLIIYVLKPNKRNNYDEVDFNKLDSVGRVEVGIFNEKIDQQSNVSVVLEAIVVNGLILD